MPQSLVTPLKNGSTTTEESNMYYIAPRNQRGNGGMIIWQHIKSLKNFKPTDTVEYVVARNKKERERSLPIYVGVGGRLIKTQRYEITFLDQFFN